MRSRSLALHFALTPAPTAVFFRSSIAQISFGILIVALVVPISTLSHYFLPL